MPTLHVKYKIMVLLETNMQFTHYKVLLSYDINWPTKPNTWNSEAHSISIFGTIEFMAIDTKNIYTSLLYIANFIRFRKVNTGAINRV